MATVPPQFQDGASHDRERDSRKQNFQQTNGLGVLGRPRYACHLRTHSWVCYVSHFIIVRTRTTGRVVRSSVSMQTAEETGAICRVIYMSVMRVHGRQTVRMGCLDDQLGERRHVPVTTHRSLRQVRMFHGRSFQTHLDILHDRASPRRCITGLMATRPFS